MEAKEAKLGEQQNELQGKLDETTNLMNEYAADQRELEKLYAAEGQPRFSGRLWIPDDLETIEL